MTGDGVKEFYEQVVKPNGYFASEDEFRKVASDPKQAKEFFENALKPEGIFGDYSEFEGVIGGGVKKNSTNESTKPLQQGIEPSAMPTTTDSITGKVTPEGIELKEVVIEPKKYAINGKNVKPSEMNEMLYDANFIDQLQSGQVKLEFPENDEAMQYLVNRQSNAGSRTGDVWNSLKAASQDMLAGAIGLDSYVANVMRSIPGLEDAGKTPQEIISELGATELKKAAEVEREKIRAYEDGFINEVKSGNIGNAISMTANTIAESTPFMIGVGATMGQGILPMLATQIPITASKEFANDETGLSNRQKVLRSTIYGGAEIGFGILPTVGIFSKNFSIGKQIAKEAVESAMRVGGEQAAKGVARGVAEKTTLESLKALGIDVTKEVGGEMATTLTQMATDDALGLTNYTAEDYQKQLLETAAISLAMTGVMTSPSIKRIVDSSIKSDNGATIKGAIFDAVEKGVIDAAKGVDIVKSIQPRIDAINTLPTEVIRNTDAVDKTAQIIELEEANKTATKIGKAFNDAEINELEKSVAIPLPNKYVNTAGKNTSELVDGQLYITKDGRKATWDATNDNFVYVDGKKKTADVSGVMNKIFELNQDRKYANDERKVEIDKEIEALRASIENKTEEVTTQTEDAKPIEPTVTEPTTQPTDEVPPSSIDKGEAVVETPTALRDVESTTKGRVAKPISKRVAVEHAGYEGAKRVTGANKNTLEIDGYGTILTSQFINTLVDNGRLPKEALKNRHIQLTEEYATKLLNDNADLFPKEPKAEVTEQAVAPKAEQPIVEEVVVEDVKPIRQLGTGANVYFETNKYRVNDDFKSGKILLNVGDANGEVPLANVKFDSPSEAVFVANKLEENAPEGLTSGYHDIDKIVQNFRQEFKDQSAPTQPTEQVDVAKEPAPAPEIKVGSVAYKENAPTQLQGRERTIPIADGTKIKGRYKIVSADDVLASHNEETFAKTENFPTNESGKTVNDRDYENDKAAQSEVVRIAGKLDSRAVSQTPIVTKDGIVVDGNNRTMSRKLAAKQGTDAEYLAALQADADMYGIDAEQISAVKNPMLIFEADQEIPYTTKEFARFNKSEKKEKSPIEKAVELSKTVSDKARRALGDIYEGAAIPSDVTSNRANMSKVRDLLISEGIIQQNELPRYINPETGTATKEGVSFLETLMIGSALNESTIRMLDNEGMGNAKSIVLKSVVQITKNAALGDNSLQSNIENGIKLLNKAKQSNQSVVDAISQMDMFEVSEFSAEDLAVAILLDGSGFNDYLKKYNSEVGTESLFEGKLTKEKLIDSLLSQRIKNYEQVRKNIRADAKGGQAEVQQGDGGVGKEGEGGKQEPSKEELDTAKKSLEENLNAINDLFKKKSDKDTGGKLSVKIPIKELVQLPFKAVDMVEKIFFDKVIDPIGDAAAKVIKRGTESSTTSFNEAANAIQALIRTAPLTTKEITSRRQKMGEIAVAPALALRFYDNALQGIGKDPTSLRNVHRVLDAEIYEKMGEPPMTYDNLNDTEKQLHDLLRTTNDAIHDWHFVNGRIDKETYDNFKGKYIARFYEEIEFENAPASLKKSFEDVSKQLNYSYIKSRKDLDEVTLKALQDPIYATARRLGQMLKNQAVIDFANQISTTTKTYNEGDADIPNNYVKLEGGGQFGNIKIYGDLTNKYVPISVAEDFKGYMFASDFAQKIYDVVKVYDRLTVRQWLKKYHTIYNPLVHVGNAMSNYTFAFWTGIDPITLTSNISAASKEIKENGDLYLELVKEGVLSTDIVTKDLKESAKEVQKGISNASQNLSGFRKALATADEKLSEIYSGVDDKAKLAAYISLVNDYKVPKSEAAKRVFDGFQNYSQVGRLYDISSKMPVFGNPYVKFKGDLVRILKNAASRKPLTTIGYMMLLSGVADLMSLMADEDEEDRILREKRAFIPSIPMPDAVGGDIPLVWQSKYGEINAARYFSPFYIYDEGNKNSILEKASDFAPIQLRDYRDKNIPLPAMNDVFLGVYAQVVWANEDFRGKRILDPSSTKFQQGVETWQEKMMNATMYIGRQQVPFFSKADDVVRALKGEEDYYGRKKDLKQMLISTVIKVEDMGSEQVKKSVEKQVDFAIRDMDAIQSLIRKVDREFEKKSKAIQEKDISEERKVSAISDALNQANARKAELLKKQADIKMDLLNRGIDKDINANNRKQQIPKKQQVKKAPKQETWKK
jgi:hypothetical protein